jgi:hypothetical protein
MINDLTSRVANYWKQILVQESRATPDCPAEDGVGRAIIPPAQLVNGSIDNRYIANLTSAMSRNNEGKLTFPVSVIVAPWVIERARGRAKSSLDSPEPLYWIPALLSEDGRLQPFDNGLPFLSRNLQSPSKNPQLAIITQDDYLGRGQLEEYWKTDWHQLIERLEQDFNSLTGSPPDRWTPNGYKISKGVILRADAENISKEKSLIRLCSELKSVPNDLFKSFVEPEPPIDSSLAREVGRLGCFTTKENPLNHKQADVANNVAVLPVGKLLAVNGPPGTGKTSLLAGVVGDVVVRALVDDAEPPVIVLTSTNNQAVVNALEEFSRDSHEAGHLSRRWLPEISGYGIHIAASTAKIKNTNLAIASVRSKVFTPHYVDRAEVFWRQNFSRVYGKSLDAFSLEVDAVRRSALRTAAKVADVARRFDEINPSFRNGMYAETKARFDELHSEARRVKGVVERCQLRLREHESELAKIKLRQEVIGRAARSTWVTCGLVERIFLFVPSVRRTVLERILLAAETAGLDKEFTSPVSSPEDLVRAIDNHLSEQVSKFERDEIATARKDLAIKCRRQDVIQQEMSDKSDWIAALDTNIRLLGADVPGIDLDKFYSDEARHLFAKAMDNGLRKKAFDLTMRCREGEFILSGLAGNHDQDNWPKNIGRGSRQKGERYYRELAKIFPVFAGTVYKISSDFSWWDRSKPEGENATPLREIVDLLVMDESGQVAPHLGAPLLALAKRALFVGDIFQLEPVVNVAENVSNKIAHDVGLGNLIEELTEHGYLVTSGSMMKAAQRATRASDTDIRTPGIMLREHFRCAESIISYCNDLVYGGHLVPRIADKCNPIIPHLASGHIRGKAVKASSSWENLIEASTIAEWISNRKGQLLGQHLGKTLADIVAVVTPFTPQKIALEKSLRARLGPSADGIIVGTVHALQGAEKPVVIFSPTVTAEDGGGGNPFFDRGPNMMNVAVSRAKEAFIVMGDMTLFDDTTSSPSGILAKHLKRNSLSRLEDVVAVYTELQDRVSSTRLANSLEHDKALKAVLDRAERKVLISSFNYAYPIKGRSEVYNWIAGAARKGVEVTIFLGLRKGTEIPLARQKLKLLSDAGAKLIISPGIHTKTVLVDDSTIIEGSFNWLAAWGGSDGFRESSILLSGDEAAEHVGRAWSEFERIKRYVESRSAMDYEGTLSIKS